MSTLILLRHGQSVWNKENRFTGFVDVDLSEKGVLEAKKAGEILKNTQIDFVFTSVLKRAVETAEYALAKKPNKEEIPLIKHEALNERHYGELQGLNKDEMRKKFGAEQIHIWRRSYDVAPPGGESLKDTCARVLPYYEEYILPYLKLEKTVLIAAHGNSIRALIMQLENLSDEEICKVEIPTGVPILYKLDVNGKFLNKEILTHE